MKILGTYEIDYGKDFKQVKNLITQEDFQNIVLPLYKGIYQAQLDCKEDEEYKLKKELKDMFGEDFFTTESPIYKALETGIMILPKIQGGEHICKVNIKGNKPHVATVIPNKTDTIKVGRKITYTEYVKVKGNNEVKTIENRATIVHIEPNYTEVIFIRQESEYLDTFERSYCLNTVKIYKELQIQ